MEHATEQTPVAVTGAHLTSDLRASDETGTWCYLPRQI
jgi:hypothetical protein